METAESMDVEGMEDPPPSLYALGDHNFRQAQIELHGLHSD